MNGPYTPILPWLEACIAALSLALFLLLVVLWCVGQCAGMGLERFMGGSWSSVDHRLSALSVRRWAARP